MIYNNKELGNHIRTNDWFDIDLSIFTRLCIRLEMMDRSMRLLFVCTSKFSLIGIIPLFINFQRNEKWEMKAKMQKCKKATKKNCVCLCVSDWLTDKLTFAYTMRHASSNINTKNKQFQYIVFVYVFQLPILAVLVIFCCWNRIRTAHIRTEWFLW